MTNTVGEIKNGFYLANDGPGVPERIRDDIFESAYSTVQGNTGSGLAIIKEIVDAHGWEISIAEASAGGARFEITACTKCTDTRID